VIDATGTGQVYDLRSFGFGLTGQGLIRYRTTTQAQSLGWPGANDSYFGQSNHAFALILEGTDEQSASTVYSYHDIIESGTDAGDNSYGGVFDSPIGQIRNAFDPPLLQYKTPLVYDPTPTTWSDQTNSGSISITGEVEGYGTLRTPAGDFEVMRVRRDYGGSFPTTDYEFLSPDVGFTVATVEGQGDGTFVVTFTAASDDFAEVAVASGATGDVLSDNRASIAFTTGSSASGQLALATYNQRPYNESFASQSASSGDGTAVTPNVLWDNQYYTVINVEDALTGFEATVCIDVTGVGGVADPDKLVLLTREFPTQAWTALNTTLNGSEICASATSFSQFAVGSNSQYNTLPVELTAFDAAVEGQDVRLTWATASETGNAGFTVEHRAPNAEAWADAGFVEGAGTTDAAQQYRYRVRSLAPGVHAFRLVQVDVDGTETPSAEITAEVRLDQSFVLTVGPNPVRHRATVSLTVREGQSVRAELFDLLGRRVRTVADRRFVRGPHTLALDAAGLASGSYLLRVTGEQFTTTRRVTVVR
jgi:hypothetical protein